MTNSTIISVSFLFIVHASFFSQDTGSNAPASSPVNQLQQLTTQLQQSPDDHALRGKIIALVLSVNPKPATPKDATMAEGAAEYAFKNAKTDSDYSDAAKQYEKALLLAPWLAADYFNCGVAHEKAGENDEAIRSFNLYLLAAPNADDAQAVTKRIGGLQYAANTPDGIADKQYGPAQRQFAALIQKLDGGFFVSEQVKFGNHNFDGVHFYKSGRYNLLMCQRQSRTDSSFNGEDRHGAWVDAGEATYVRPTDGIHGDIRFRFPHNGHDFFACTPQKLLLSLSTDGRTIELIGFSDIDFKEETIQGVWHRQ